MKIFGDLKIKEKIVLPHSKSYGIRALFLASLSTNRDHFLYNLPKSQDFLDAISALKALGVHIQQNNDGSLKVRGSQHDLGSANYPVEVYAGEGAAVARFLFSYLARKSSPFILQLHPRLFLRPHGEYIEFLRLHGVQIDTMESKHSYLIRGPFKFPSKMEVDFNVSSQFASALALATADYDHEIMLVNPIPSMGYFQMTLSMIQEFKKGRTHWSIPSDMSALPFALNAALLKGEIVVENFHGPDKLQPDYNVLKLWERYGGKFKQMGTQLVLSAPMVAGGFELNVLENPDLLPPMIYWSSKAQESCIATGVSYLANKESHRLAEIKKVLHGYGFLFGHDPEKDRLVIFPSKIKPKSFNYHCPDHRMLMSVYFFMKSFGGGDLTPEDSVDKSWPGFFSDFEVDDENEFS